MSPSKRFARKARDLKRRPPRIESCGKSFLIVTEGEKTEPNYFKALIRHLRLAPADVDFDSPPATDPLNLVLRADDLRAARKKAAKSGPQVEYDEVWVVFDLEKTHDERKRLAKQAMTRKEAKGMMFAISDPCFEY